MIHTLHTITLSTKAERLRPGMRAFHFFVVGVVAGSIFGNGFSGAGHPPVDVLGHSGIGPGRSWVEWMGLAHPRNGGEPSA